MGSLGYETERPALSLIAVAQHRTGLKHSAALDSRRFLDQPQ